MRGSFLGQFLTLAIIGFGGHLLSFVGGHLCLWMVVFVFWPVVVTGCLWVVIGIGIGRCVVVAVGSCWVVVVVG